MSGLGKIAGVIALAASAMFSLAPAAHAEDAPAGTYETYQAPNTTPKRDPNDWWTVRDETYYTSVSIGYGIASPMLLEQTRFAVPGRRQAATVKMPHESADLDDGYQLIGALGRYANPFRFEGEIAFRDNDVNGAHSNPVTAIKTLTVGNLRTYSAIINMYYDFPIAKNVDLYIGGGGGLGWAHARLTHFSDVTAGTGFTFKHTATTVAYQALAGVAWHFSNNLTLTGGYRGFSTLDLDFHGTKFDAPLYHSLEIGLRFDLD